MSYLKLFFGCHKIAQCGIRLRMCLQYLFSPRPEYASTTSRCIVSTRASQHPSFFPSLSPWRRCRCSLWIAAISKGHFHSSASGAVHTFASISRFHGIRAHPRSLPEQSIFRISKPWHPLCSGRRAFRTSRSPAMSRRRTWHS